MPRWLFLTFVAAVVLAVFGSAVVVLRGTPSAPANPGPAAGLQGGSSPYPAITRAA